MTKTEIKPRNIPADFQRGKPTGFCIVGGQQTSAEDGSVSQQVAELDSVSQQASDTADVGEQHDDSVTGTNFSSLDTGSPIDYLRFNDNPHIEECQCIVKTWLKT